MPTANSYIPKEGEKVDILIAGRYSYTAVVQSVHTQEFEPFAKVLTPNNVLHHVALNRLTAHQPDIFEAKADPPSEVPSAPSVPYDPSAPPTRSRTPIDTTEIDPAPSDPVPSPITHHPSLASCTLCGCTEMCACPGGCSWQEANLCTACHWALIRGRLAEKLTEDANYWSCQRDILTAEFRSGQSTIHNPQSTIPGSPPQSTIPNPQSTMELAYLCAVRALDLRHRAYRVQQALFETTALSKFDILAKAIANLELSFTTEDTLIAPTNNHPSNTLAEEFYNGPEED